MPTNNHPVNTTQIRGYLQREPARTRGCAGLILALCNEIDRLHAELFARYRALEDERLRRTPPPAPRPAADAAREHLDTLHRDHPPQTRRRP